VIHTANSSATLRDARYHQRMVRVGFGWAGYARDMLADSPAGREAECFRPCVTWESSLIQIKHLPEGHPVGYGSRWITPRDSIIGVVPVGYASGYPNRVGATSQDGALGWVRVVQDESDATSGDGAMYAPVVGAVSMDQLTVDLTDIAQRRDDRLPQVGDVVELITPDPQAPNHLPTLAANARKLPYEIICGLHQRVRRRYDARITPTPEILADGRQTIAAVG
jgi:alanine racemase